MLFAYMPITVPAAAADGGKCGKNNYSRQSKNAPV
jgi:hypothetical protein